MATTKDKPCSAAAAHAEHQRLADPVGHVDDAQTIGVAVGDEDAEGERGAQRSSPTLDAKSILLATELVEKPRKLRPET